MSLPVKACGDPVGHREMLEIIQARLRKQYDELLRTAPPKRMMPATTPIPARTRSRRRPLPTLVENRRARQRPPLGISRPPLRRRQDQWARLFMLMFLLHVIVFAGLLIAELMDSTRIWKSIGIAIIIWMVFRGLAALSRRIRAPRRRTSRVAGRGGDRDIFL